MSLHPVEKEFDFRVLVSNFGVFGVHRFDSAVLMSIDVCFPILSGHDFHGCGFCFQYIVIIRLFEKTCCRRILLMFRAFFANMLCGGSGTIPYCKICRMSDFIIFISFA